MKGLVAYLNYREFEVINLAAQPPGRLAVSLTATTDNEPRTTISSPPNGPAVKHFPLFSLSTFVADI